MMNEKEKSRPCDDEKGQSPTVEIVQNENLQLKEQLSSPDPEFLQIQGAHRSVSFAQPQTDKPKKPEKHYPPIPNAPWLELKNFDPLYHDDRIGYPLNSQRATGIFFQGDFDGNNSSSVYYGDSPLMFAVSQDQ